MFAPHFLVVWIVKPITSESQLLRRSGLLLRGSISCMDRFRPASMAFYLNSCGDQLLYVSLSLVITSWSRTEKHCHKHLSDEFPKVKEGHELSCLVKQVSLVVLMTEHRPQKVFLQHISATMRSSPVTATLRGWQSYEMIALSF